MRHLAGCLLLASAVCASSGARASDKPASFQACLPSDLFIHLLSQPYSVRYPGTHPTRYFTGVNAFVGPTLLPCYLFGTPTISLVSSGKPVAVPYKQNPTLTLYPPGGGLSYQLAMRADSLLLPGDKADLVFFWQAPYCGRPFKAAVQIHLLTGVLTSMQDIVSPPCKQGWPYLLSNDSWRIQHGVL